MEYGIRELAEMAGVSARTLRWYDSLGLLKPCRVGENGYRFYSSAEADRLQHILFYRALGVDLKQIAALLDNPAFDRLSALRDHLAELESRREQLDDMIASLRRTISAEERNERIMDHEKFEAFKRDAVAKNEAKYGAEARSKYGDAAVDASNKRMMDLSQQQYNEKESLEAEILSQLEAAVRSGASPDSDEGRQIVDLHRRWLAFTWLPPTAEAYKGLVQMYICDERFTQYYDRTVSGCAQFLCDAVHAAL